MSGHMHAASMALYAADAAEYVEPWLKWEFRQFGKVAWIECSRHPDWDKRTSFQRKTVTIAKCVKIPEPLRVAPEMGDKVHTADPIAHDTANMRYVSFTWSGSAWDKELLTRGLLHLTLEAARAHADALISISR